MQKSTIYLVASILLVTQIQTTLLAMKTQKISIQSRNNGLYALHIDEKQLCLQEDSFFKFSPNKKFIFIKEGYSAELLDVQGARPKKIQRFDFAYDCSFSSNEEYCLITTSKTNKITKLVHLETKRLINIKKASTLEFDEIPLSDVSKSGLLEKEEKEKLQTQIEIPTAKISEKEKLRLYIKEIIKTLKDPLDQLNQVEIDFNFLKNKYSQEDLGEALIELDAKDIPEKIKKDDTYKKFIDAYLSLVEIQEVLYVMLNPQYCTKNWKILKESLGLIGLDNINAEDIDFTLLKTRFTKENIGAVFSTLDDKEIPAKLKNNTQYQDFMREYTSFLKN